MGEMQEIGNTTLSDGNLSLPWYITYPMPRGVLIFHIISDCVIIIFTLIGNTLTFIAFHRIRKSEQEEYSGIFILSLAFTDIVTGTVAVPVFVFRKLIVFIHGNIPIHIFTGKQACLVMVYFSVWPSVSSISCMLMIAVNRFIATKFPLRYPTLMSKSRCVFMILFALSYSTVTVSVSLGMSYVKLDTWDHNSMCIIERITPNTLIRTLGIVLTCFIPLSVTFSLHAYVGYQAFKKEKQHSNTYMDASHPFVQRHKITKAMLLIIGVFCICATPNLIVRLISVPPNVSWWYETINFLLIDVFYLNSAINPWIYSKYLMKTVFKTSLLKLSGCHSGRVNIETGTISTLRVANSTQS